MDHFKNQLSSFKKEIWQRHGLNLQSKRGSACYLIQDMNQIFTEIVKLLYKNEIDQYLPTASAAQLNDR